MSHHKNCFDSKKYPFKSSYKSLQKGQMGYNDEGQGDVLQFVHDNPSWSFYFRKIIKGVSRFNRRIAIDDLGFGLSEKSDQRWFSASERAGYLEEFIEKMDITKFSMVMHDVPIVLSYALKFPERINKMVIDSSWMWNMSDGFRIQVMSRLLVGTLGKFLVVSFNLIAKRIYRNVFIGKVSDNVYKHYHMHLSEPGHRHVTWLLPKSLLSQRGWLQGLWDRRDAIRKRKVLLARGIKDSMLDEKHFEQWQSVFYDSKVEKFKNSGYCPEVSRIIS